MFLVCFSWSSLGALKVCSLQSFHSVFCGAQVVFYLRSSPSVFYEQFFLLLMLYGHSPNASHKLETLLILFGHSLITI